MSPNSSTRANAPPGAEQAARSATEPRQSPLVAAESPHTSSTTSVTQPEMPATKIAVDSPPRVPRSVLPAYTEDDDPITEVGVRHPSAGPSAPLARDRAVLVRLDGAHAGEVHAVGSRPIGLGRHQSNLVRSDDAGVSRNHARIEIVHGVHYIEDLGSRNGTFVQGLPVKRTALSHGDSILLGPRVSLRYSLTDATEEQLLKQMYESSTRDALTGAYNRKHFDERLRAEVAYSQRHATETSLLILDIDHFKKINDTHGHPTGDAVLRQLVATVSRRLRTEDLLARVGGEEFAIVLRGIQRQGAALVAERIRALVAALPTVVGAQVVSLTISAGCASLACCSVPSPEELMAVADRRLYAAKRAGRNRVVASD